MFRKLIQFYFILILTGCLEQQNLTVGNPVKLIFDQQPGSGLASSILSQQPRIIIADYLNNKITSGPDAWAKITLTLSSGSGSLIGTTSAYAVLGQIQFSDLKIDLTGVKKITATKDDLSLYGGAPAISAESSSFTITQGSGSQLVYSGPTSFDAGVCTQISVATADQGLNPVTTSTNITIDLSGAGSGSFYSDSSCSTAISTTTINSGSSSSTLFYKNFSQENLNLIFVDRYNNYTNALLSTYVNPARIQKIYVFTPNTINQAHCDLYELGYVRCSESLFGFSYGGTTSQKTHILNKKIIDVAMQSSNGLLLKDMVFLTEDGKVYQGLSSYAQVPITGLATQVVGSYDYFCALVNNSGTQSVQCWGKNNLRQLGDGTTIDRTNPVTVSLNLPMGVSIVKLYAESYSSSSGFTFAVLSTGEVILWGNNLNPTYLAGINDAVDIKKTMFGTEAAIITQSRTVQKFNFNFTAPNIATVSGTPVTVNGLNNVESIGLINTNRICALNTQGFVYCAGMRQGHVGIPYPMTGAALNFPFKVKSLSSNYTQFFAIDYNNPTQVIAWNDTLSRAEPEYKPLTTTVESIQISTVNNIVSFYPKTCNLVTVTNNYNLSSQVTNKDLTLSLSDLTQQGHFYSDAACTRPITTKTIPKNLASRNIYFYSNYDSTEPQTVYMQAQPLTTSGTTAANKTIMIAGDANKIGIDSANYIYNNVCTNVRLKGLDQYDYDTYLTKSASMTISFSITGNGKVFSDSSCTQEISSAPVPAGRTPFIDVYAVLYDVCSYFSITASAPGLQDLTFSLTEDCSN